MAVSRTRTISLDKRGKDIEVKFRAFKAARYFHRAALLTFFSRRQLKSDIRAALGSLYLRNPPLINKKKERKKEERKGKRAAE